MPGLLGSATCFTLMVVYIALAWTIVFTWRIGPVIASIDAGSGRGVHSGDMLAIPLVLMGLFLYAEGVVGIHHGGCDRRLRHRGADRANTPTIRIGPVSSALLAMQKAAA